MLLLVVLKSLSAGDWKNVLLLSELGLMYLELFNESKSDLAINLWLVGVFST